MTEVKVLGIVPARSGSKSVPDKNLQIVGGKPLLAHTAVTAVSCAALDRVILSTDSQQIADVGRCYGLDVPFLRPAELARDDTHTEDVVQHALEYLEHQGWVADLIVVLQPTSPLRTVKHIEDAIAIFRADGVSSVVSVIEVPERYVPQKACVVVDNRLTWIMPMSHDLWMRQDLPRYHVVDGSIYAFTRDLILNRGTFYGVDCAPLIIDERDSLDVNDWTDLAEADRRLRNRHTPSQIHDTREA